MASSHLPKLPIRPLEDLCRDYLRSVEPFVNKEEMEATKKAVEEFMGPNGAGHQLHAQLLERQRALPNWLSDWWLQVRAMSLCSHCLNGTAHPISLSWRI